MLCVCFHHLHTTIASYVFSPLFFFSLYAFLAPHNTCRDEAVQAPDFGICGSRSSLSKTFRCQSPQRERELQLKRGRSSSLSANINNQPSDQTHTPLFNTSSMVRADMFSRWIYYYQQCNYGCCLN